MRACKSIYTMESFTVHAITLQALLTTKYQTMWRASCLANFTAHPIFYTLQAMFKELRKLE